MQVQLQASELGPVAVAGQGHVSGAEVAPRGLKSRVLICTCP
jgi:hypothetical protein